MFPSFSLPSLMLTFSILFNGHPHMCGVLASPGLLSFPPLSQEINGSLHHSVVDLEGKIYGSGYQPSLLFESSGFVSKLSRRLELIWRSSLESLPLTAPAITFSESGGLFAIVARNTSTPGLLGLVDIVLHELEIDTGIILRTTPVDTVYLANGSLPKCIFSSVQSELPVIYITYIVSNATQGSQAHTVVGKFSKSKSGTLTKDWDKSLRRVGRRAVSADFAEDTSSGQIVVAEVSGPGPNMETDLLELYYIDRTGDIVMDGSVSTASNHSLITDLEIDNKGTVYVAESPSWLHQIALQVVLDAVRFSTLWTVPSIDILEMVLLRNGSALYVLAKGDGFRDDGGSIVRTPAPILAVFNSTGDSQFRKEFIESNPAIEREMLTMSLLKQEESSKAILGGSFRFIEGNSQALQVAMGEIEFPSADRVAEEEPAPIEPLPLLSDPPVVGDNSNSTYVALGVAFGVLLLFATIGSSLLVTYRKWRAGDKRQELVEGTEANVHAYPIREEKVLV